MHENSHAVGSSDLSWPDLKVAAAAVAQRGSTFYRILGPQEDREWLDSVLELLWSVADGQDVGDECAQVLEELGEESQADDYDSSHSEFFAARSLEVIGNALSVALRPDRERVECSFLALRELLSILDFRLGGSVPVITRYGDPPPPPGPLESGEIKAELLVREELSPGADRTDAVSRIRNESVRFSVELGEPIGYCFDEEES